MPERMPISRRQMLRTALLTPLALTACGGAQPRPATIPHATPTVAAFFQQSQQLELVPTPRSQASLGDGPAQRRQPQVSDQFDEFVIFDDVLHEDWTFEHSFGVQYDLASRDNAFSGRAAAAVTPLAGNGEFFVSVRQGARQAYLRERIAGVSVRLSGGPGSIETQDLGMRITGSNAYRHWIPNDQSVEVEGRDTSQDNPVFLFSRLYYLDINHAIEPNTWVEVINWLDDRIYDPKYVYLTGFAVKNDAAFINTYYIDRITLLLMPV